MAELGSTLTTLGQVEAEPSILGQFHRQIVSKSGWLVAHVCRNCSMLGQSCSLRIFSRGSGQRLFAYLFRRLSQMMQTTAAGAKNGFEVFRRILHEEDTITASTRYGLRFSLQQLLFQECNTIIETMCLLRTMDTNISEHRDKTAKELDEVLKIALTHGAMGAESYHEVRHSHVELEFGKIKGFVEDLYHEDEEKNRDCGQTTCKFTGRPVRLLSEVLKATAPVSRDVQRLRWFCVCLRAGVCRFL